MFLIWSQGSKLIFITGNGIIQTGNGIIQTGNGIIQTGNGIIQTGNGIVQTGNGIIPPSSRHLIKKLLLQMFLIWSRKWKYPNRK
jgi:hypothetical protein